MIFKHINVIVHGLSLTAVPALNFATTSHGINNQFEFFNQCLISIKV